MSLALSIRLDRDSVRPALQSLRAALGPERLHAAIGTEVKRLIQSHLLTLGTNKRGWPTTNFWARAAKATSDESDARSATVSINQIGVRQRYYGGTITPTRRRFLTIPISPEAYGKTASDFPNSFLITTKKGAYIVQRGESISAAGNVVKSRGRGFAAKRVVAALEFLFKLSRGVTQEPDPNVLPSEEAITAAALTAVRRNLDAAV